MVKCCVAHGKSKFILWQDRQIPFLPLQFRAFWDVKRTILRSTCSLGWNRDRRSWGHSDSGSAPLQKTSLCLVSFHGGPSRNLPGGSAGGHGQRTQTSQPSRTRGFHAASGRRACSALNKGLETCLQRPLPQLPVEKRDEFLALQKGCGTWLSLQHAQSRAGLSPTALPGQSPRVTGGDHVPDDLLQHRLPQSQPPTLSTKTLTASTRQVPQGPSFSCVFLHFYHSVKNNPLSL